MILRALQDSCDSTAQAPSAAASTSAQPANTRDISRKLEAKNAAVERALAPQEAAGPAALEAGMDVVQLLQQKWEAQQGGAAAVRMVLVCA